MTSVEKSDRPATIYDVAREAGVSQQTVSRLVKGADNVGAALRERIERAIAELDYHPNQAARTLTTRRSRVIGALAQDISEIGPSLIVQGASERAREAGYFFEIVTVSSSDESGTASSIDLLKGREFAGILAVSPSDEVTVPPANGGPTIPFHVAHAANDGDRSINRLGMTMLIEHLAELGHRRFRFISGPDGSLSARNRSSAFDAAVRRRGLTVAGVHAGDWSAGSGYTAVMEASDIDATAVVCANDQMAIGAVSALEARGLSVPDDVSVVGFDDIPEAPYLRPPLTTISQDMKQQGRLAIDALLREVDPGLSLDPLEPIRPVLMVRGSTAAPPSSSGGG